MSQEKPYDLYDDYEKCDKCQQKRMVFSVSFIRNFETLCSSCYMEEVTVQPMTEMYRKAVQSEASSFRIIGVARLYVNSLEHLLLLHQLGCAETANQLAIKWGVKV